ncbi:adenosylmethionine--8-amino-7-oxononanoate aminotransferase [Alteromonas mediterranea DE]|uniref:Adenosylmethionine-8-amino-7-oxononanoate aminotransferase n=1 Tax=Alteromonas mediterranea (strain DSM 17117 / CIP 110805 / LMG 28347 / Deep ecotype) TaxID=1774373 RepID=F2G6Q5_ALTMD|nr:adenosylmethionine--8-amino-7-oxononanoate transaminase [Alteromonas mediterranea]AEA97592.1 adenosylmethionine--8-amino-7-oxononanoate aminotransferase [Alteromonas mediterranea DE]CAH1214440.1 Adenosylmethionine-8-amino-7-oxononanoate aminotransferase [Alteromonas mediterranea]|tara:strand:+ start:15241 stop:16566 length:1326 start_codon:yes stop_codon:yes gene_type:complete
MPQYRVVNSDQLQTFTNGYFVNNIEFDKQHIWHPYTSAVNPLPCYEVVGAEGVELTLASSEVLIDGMSSWWAAIHGYNHPVLNDAAHKQIEAFSHVMFGGITHQPAVDLCKTLLNMVPAGLERVFLADSGSVSVEVAIKMAIQYWACQGRPEKSRIVSPRNGYHGDTFAAMSVCDPVNGMHSLFEGVLNKQIFAPAPQTRFEQTFSEDDILPLEDIFEKHHHTMAALILEPVVQGAGGMRIYHPEYLKRCRQLCDTYDVLLICDEIATGFGRTGKLFACEHAGISPDILCLGKAITGGYMTLAATLCTEDVALGVCQGEPGVFMHGPTYMGNPLACAVANASLSLINENHWQQQIPAIEKQLQSELEKCADLPRVADVRVLGAIGVVETVNPVNVAEIQRHFVKQGVWIRPFGKLVYIMPPYVISAEQLSKLTHAIYTALK